ncbi:anti-sigma K factor RskA [Aureimonas endophytica]|uniref:Anti-sigma K factor RskA n=1 Tax=Aureimonas endophytica TaxID=2027858 RepID=A0A916ZGK1_9HYPH|nr:anti-sigma factor [Aureimonas endophytica]GGD96099.1 anti-sigma K factor RskA [Aureimonas endophytica]
MSDFSPSPEDEDDLRAAEHALGLGEAGERRRLARRLRDDADFRRRVETWEARLAPLLAGVSPVEAPPGVLARVEAELDQAARARPAPANDNRALLAWKWFGLGSFGLLAASLVMLFVLVSNPPGAGPQMTAVIASDGGPALYAAVIDARTGQATLIPVGVPAAGDPAHAHELWAILPGGEPRSLGVMPPGGAMRLVLPPGTVAGDMTLAISLEPPGGSPTGKPTGPVMGTGAVQGI